MHRAPGQPWEPLKAPAWASAAIVLGTVFFTAGFFVGPYLFAVGVITLLTFSIYMNGRHYRQQLVHNHRCPCCLYDLKALRPEPDGCTTCPECAAAWHLPRRTHA